MLRGASLRSTGTTSSEKKIKGSIDLVHIIIHSHIENQHSNAQVDRGFEKGNRESSSKVTKD
jgi:hypothetical protein